MLFEGLEFKKFDIKNKDNEKVQEIFIEAFPANERPKGDFIPYLDQLDGVFSYLIYDEDNLVGIFMHYFTDKTLFLSYFAIDNKCRGKGYGSKTLSFIKYLGEKEYNKPIFLTVETLNPSKKNYEQRKNRIKFYEKNGFSLIDITYEERGESYTVMVSDTSLGIDFWNEATEKVISFEEEMEKVLEELNKKTQLNEDTYK